jgi:hypothetical protein
MEMVWLYWNSAQASNLGAVVTIASAISGYIALGAPPAYWSVVGRPLLAGQTQPSQFVTKDPNGIVHVYWDVTDLLLHRDASAMYNSHTGYEGIDYVTPSAEAGATTAVTGAQTRFVQANDRLYVRSQHTGGSDATTETIYLAVLTKAGSSGSSARTIYCAAQLAVDDAA